MGFLRPLILEYLDGRRWRLNESFGYTLRTGRRITVPAGFETDFASVPRVFWRVLPPTGDYGKAAVIHDYLYSKGLMPREEADRVFLNAMKDLKVNSFIRRSMWAAVRSFGWIPWRRYREA